MAADKHSDLPASERHLGWAISAVLAGAMVRRETWCPGVYWALGDDGRFVLWHYATGEPVPVDLGESIGASGFYIYEPEGAPVPEPEPRPVTESRFRALSDGLASQARARDEVTRRLLRSETEEWVRNIRNEIRGEFDALSARITEVSRMTQNVTTRATGTIGGVDLSKLR